MYFGCLSDPPTLTKPCILQCMMRVSLFGRRCENDGQKAPTGSPGATQNGHKSMPLGSKGAPEHISLLGCPGDSRRVLAPRPKEKCAASRGGHFGVTVGEPGIRYRLFRTRNRVSGDSVLQGSTGTPPAPPPGPPRGPPGTPPGPSRDTLSDPILSRFGGPRHPCWLHAPIHVFME